MSTSTYCFISRLRKANGLVTRAVIPVLSLLNGLLIALKAQDTRKPRGTREGYPYHGQLFLLSAALIALQFVLFPAAAFASSSIVNSYTFGSDQPLDQASVSVVRIVVAYAPIPTLTPPPAPGCTSTASGLGVFVGSWPTTTGGTDFTNTVLSDGSLVDPNGTTCTSGKGALSTVQMYVNDAYTNANPATALLKTFQCQARPNGSCTDASSKTSVSFVCQDSATCADGIVLISFHTTSPQPFIDLANAAQSSQDTSATFGVELAGPKSSTGVTPTVEQATSLLTPVAVNNPTDPTNEWGMPIVTQLGQLADMHIHATDTAGAIRDYVSTQLTPLQNGHSNSLHDSWNAGIADYYKSDYTDAQTAFKNAGTHNAVFRAGVAFWTLATAKAGVITKTGGSSNGNTPGVSRTSTPTTGVNAFGVFIPDNILTVLLVGALVLLVIILALITFAFVRRQMRQRRNYAKLNQIAEADAQRIKQEEEQERLRARGHPIQEQSPANVKSAVGIGSATPQSALVQPTVVAQGQGQFMPPPQSSHAEVPPQGQFVPIPQAFPPAKQPPVSSLPMGSQAPPPPMSSPLGLIPSADLSEMPTEEIPFGSGSEGLYTGTEVTQPRGIPNPPPSPASAPVEQFTGRKLGLIVGTRSDPGIKRQHKPNEDSLYAAEGMLNNNAQAPQFGLFVVADGMGGHANGKDASRLAIQTIVETLLPRLTGNETLNERDFAQLLAGGVQQANAAVHERNMEHHADMGTTMTATLVVGTTAYMANVGDSRTYLYRQPDGLKKVTHDHSVVASLVEAGIIKPDDVYTHSQRNQIYRSLGEKPVVDVDTFIVPLKAGDKIILCSDGLWEMVRDPSIEQLLNTVPDPSQTRNALIQEALNKGGEDNVSVIVVHIADSPQGNGINGVQVLAKPDEPQYPPM